MSRIREARRGTVYGVALRSFFDGAGDATLLLRSDLGEEDEIPVRVFFREPDDFFDFEREALRRCRGRVLDIGAGTGLHALVLQERGIEVCALEIVPEAVEIMGERGVADPRRGDVFTFRDPAGFDTLLLLMNGVGLVGTIEGLERFLDHARSLLAPGGQVLLDSADLRESGGAPAPAADDPEAPDLPTREDGRYVGEAQIQLEFDGVRGEPFPELYLDPDTLGSVCRRRGWSTKIVWTGAEGAYVARLTPPEDPHRAS